jgi:hypothetical protein
MNQLLKRSDLDDDVGVAILDLRAEALDSLDRAAAAFDDYQSRNMILARRFAPRMAREVSERYMGQAS